jgi:glycine cleavage system aminomethyltransferase T
MTVLDALKPRDAAPGVVLRSAMEHRFRAAGARFESRGGWLVPISLPGEQDHLERVAFADASFVGKLELRGGAAPADAPDRHVIEVSEGRWIVLCPAAAQPALARELDGSGGLLLDMTGAWSTLVLAGPRAEQLLRRLGPVASVPGAGPVAGVQGRVLARAGALWLLTATEFAQHVHDVVADRCEPLGGGPAGLDAVLEATADPLLGAAHVEAAP